MNTDLNKFWMAKYLNIPYKLHGSSFDGCDCGGLLRLVYREELGIILPNWSKNYKNTLKGDFKDLDSVYEEETSTIGDFPMKVDLADAQPFDALCFCIGTLRVHTGVVVRRGRMLHISEGMCASVEDYEGLKWSRRLMGVYRHVSRIG